MLIFDVLLRRVFLCSGCFNLYLLVYRTSLFLLLFEMSVAPLPPVAFTWILLYQNASPLLNYSRTVFEAFLPWPASGILFIDCIYHHFYYWLVIIYHGSVCHHVLLPYHIWSISSELSSVHTSVILGLKGTRKIV